MSMATMNIKDPAIREAVRELAERRHTTMTDAVRQAVNEALVQERLSREGIAERILEIAARARARGGTYLSEDDLYDENGLPN